MGKRGPRRKFSEEDKRKAVSDYISGARRAMDIANELQVAVGLIYRWKSEFEFKEKDQRIEELTAQGANRAAAIKIEQQAEEIAMYQKKLAELTLINELLKKLQTSPPSLRESELSGLIATFKRSAQKSKPAGL